MEHRDTNHAGTIVYLAAGAEPRTSPVKEGALLRDAGLDPARTVIASSRGGWPAPQKAILELVRRGATQIEMRRGRWKEGAGLVVDEDGTVVFG